MTHHQEPQSTGDSPTQKPVRSTNRPPIMRSALLLLLLALTLIYALFASPIAPWPLFEAIPPVHRTVSEHARDERELPQSLMTTAPRDKRLAAALAKAIERRLALSGADGSAPPTVAYRIGDGPGEDDQVGYEIDGVRYQLTLSSQPGQATENLQRLRALLERIAPMPSQPAASMTAATEASIPFNTRDLLIGLAKLDPRLGEGSDADRLLQAAQLYAWQGFFKTAIEDRGLADVLATEALACHLAAGTRDPFVEGLIWLALDRPVPARAAFQEMPAEATAG